MKKMGSTQCGEQCSGCAGECVKWHNHVEKKLAASQKLDVDLTSTSS